MDPNAFADLLLIVCLAILIAVVAFRALVGLMYAGRKARGAAPVPTPHFAEERAVEAPAGEQAVQAPGPGLPTARHGLVKSDFADGFLSKVNAEEMETIRSTARELVDYSLARGGVSRIPPKVLDDMALQYALLETALKRIHPIPDPGVSGVAEGSRDELFREGFRLLVTKAR